MLNTVIKVENLSKYYKLGTIGSGTLYRDIQSWWARFRGIEDPNMQIDAWNSEQRDTNNSFWALKDISFEIKEGDVVGIIGRNGAGKSTLLKILSKITGPTNGNIKIKGRVASLLEVGTGFHPELTGRENVYLNGTILGMRKAEIDRKFDEIVEFAEINNFIDTPVKRYSSGMYVRLAFAVAAHLDPEILIVEEVLAVGDANFQKKCLGKMGDVSREGRTVLFVSHNMNAVTELCKSCILLEKGHLTDYGDTNRIVRNYLTEKNKRNIGEIDLTNPSLRKNSLEDSKFKWKKARILNSQNMYTAEIDLKESFSFEFTACVTENSNDVKIGFGIMSPMGYPMYNSHYEDSGNVDANFTPGEVVFKVDFLRNNFLPGTYKVDLGAKAIGVIDWLPVAFEFTINEFEKSTQKGLRLDFSGVVIPDCSWNQIK